MDMTLAWGIGLVTVAIDGETLDIWHPCLHLGTMTPGEDIDLLGTLTAVQGQDDARRVRMIAVTCKVGLGDRLQFTVDTYLRLHLLSHRLVKLNTINLDGIASHLPNVMWTAQGPCAAEGFEETHLCLCATLDHPVVMLSADRLPAMVHYIVPGGMHIADGTRVRLGVYLTEGTSVVHAVFVNYNADTFGRCAAKGRISQGVIIDDGSDVGGGTSTMGTLSGDGRNRIRLGKRCLLGTNSGLGIPLGDDCITEAGPFLTAEVKIAVMKVGDVVPDVYGPFVEPPYVPVHMLADASDVLFRRNPQSGRIEALSRGGRSIEIPEDAGPHI